MLIILGIIFAIMFVGRFTSLLDSSLSETQYKNVVTDYTSGGDDGTNPLRVAVYSIPTIIAFIGRKKHQKCDDVLIYFCTNASIISTGLYALSMFTSGMYLGRIPIYLSLYNYILLPWEIKNIIPEKSRSVITVGIIVLYLVFYYYQFHIAWSFM